MVMMRTACVAAVSIDVMAVGVHAMTKAVILLRSIGMVRIRISADKVVPVEAVAMPRMAVAIRAMIAMVASFGGVCGEQ
jgi:hypothetical protein